MKKKNIEKAFRSYIQAVRNDCREEAFIPLEYLAKKVNAFLHYENDNLMDKDEPEEISLYPIKPLFLFAAGMKSVLWKKEKLSLFFLLKITTKD